MNQNLSGKTIFVVEDNYFAGMDLVRQLNEAGAEVLGPISSVEEALRQLRSAPLIDGAVLDINLGGHMVFPVADELDRRGTPFIFATGYEADVVPPRHADKVLLRKPLDDDDLVSALLHVTLGSPVSADRARQNWLLAHVPEAELSLLLPFLREVHLPRGAVMEQPGQSVTRVCFPIGNVVSVLTVGAAGSRIETGLIGREGMTGYGLISGDEGTSFELLNQIEGSMLAISAHSLRSILRSLPGLCLLSHRFVRALGVQVGYTVLATGRADLQQRLARWLIMIEDRIQQPTINLTHEYLSVMLGVRRPSVTDTLHILEGERLIRSTRGCVEILDREGLIRTAGEIYGPPEAEYGRLMRIPLPVTREPPLASPVPAS